MRDSAQAHARTPHDHYKQTRIYQDSVQRWRLRAALSLSIGIILLGLLLLSAHHEMHMVTGFGAPLPPTLGAGFFRFTENHGEMAKKRLEIL
jgi:hypothetical protein